MAAMIRVNNFKYIYPDGTEIIIEGKDEEVLEIGGGEKSAILGANGSGKTTLLLTIMGLVRPVKGKVEVAGFSPAKDFHKVRKKIGVMLQNAEEQIIGPRVFDDIAFSLRQDRVPPAEISKKVKDIASLLGIEKELEKIPHYLSGGEKQKVALAGALIHEPEILVLDEPLDNLDAYSRQVIEKILNDCSNERGVTVILTTHDVNWVASWADSIYLLAGGKVINRGNPEEVLMNDEKLHMAGIRPPVLASLFKSLQQKGYNGKIPFTVAEAKKLIEDNFYFK